MLSNRQNASQNEYLYFLAQGCVYLEGFINALVVVTQNYSETNNSQFSVITDVITAIDSC